jgi:hypothetical protein
MGFDVQNSVGNKRNKEIVSKYLESVFPFHHVFEKLKCFIYNDYLSVHRMWNSFKTWKYFPVLLLSFCDFYVKVFIMNLGFRVLLWGLICRTLWAMNDKRK